MPQAEHYLFCLSAACHLNAAFPCPFPSHSSPPSSSHFTLSNTPSTNLLNASLASPSGTFSKHLNAISP